MKNKEKELNYGPDLIEIVKNKGKYKESREIWENNGKVRVEKTKKVGM